MREIKFRGKRLDNGEWIYGYYGHKEASDQHFIMVETMNLHHDWTYFTDYEVYPETVGQYTGLHDRNGRGIYEGDILDVDGTPWLVEPIGTEERDGGKFGLCASPYGSGEAYFIDKSILDGKVIGNIYEHPHLLEAESV